MSVEAVAAFTKTTYTGLDAQLRTFSRNYPDLLRVRKTLQPDFDRVDKRLARHNQTRSDELSSIIPEIEAERELLKLYVVSALMVNGRVDVVERLGI